MATRWSFYRGAAWRYGTCRAKNRLLALPTKDRIQDDGMCRLIGTRDRGLGLLTTGAEDSTLWFHEVRSSPDHFQRRLVERAAARRVQTLLDEGATLEDVRESIAGPGLLPEVRAAAMRVLDVTGEDPFTIIGDIFERLMRGQPRTRLEDSLRRLEQLEPQIADEPLLSWHAITLKAMVHYELERDVDALEALRRAASMDRPVHLAGYAAWVARDFQSMAWFYGAMAAQRLGDEDAKRWCLEQAWSQGIGGKYDELGAKMAYGRLQLRSPGASGKEGDIGMVTGPPDAARHVASANAWYPLRPDEGRYVLELQYERPVHVTELRIYEVNVSGAVHRVELVSADAGQSRIWPLESSATRPGTLRVKPPDALDWEANRVRLHLDASRRKGSNGIDTVQLVGAEGSDGQWPIRARLIATAW